jgi:curved DNA-binding protein CbpA
MTKDYYKILSLRSDATDEEIRGRWIELVKSYHIDFDMGEFDERVKDINDAYHVLKNPATRLEYDLERTFEGKKRGFHVNKWVPRVGFGIILIVLCLVYFENPEMPYHLLKKSQAVTVLPVNQKQLPASNSQKPPAAQVAGEDATTSGQAPFTLQPRQGVDVDKGGDEAGLSPKQDALPDAGKPAEVRVGDQAPSARPPADTNKAGQTNRLQKTVARNSLSSKNAGRAPIEKVTKTAQVNTPGPKSSKPSAPASASPAALLAREDEVKEFFSNYTKAYNRIDVNAFLGLFSHKAVQNRKENFDNLKETYERFFNQSRELHYRLQDLKFEIYLNAVEATARYVLDQVSKRNGTKQTWRGTVRWALVREDGALKIISVDFKHQESH